MKGRWIVLAAVALLAGCGGGGPGDEAARSRAGGEEARRVTVFAAASLTEAFRDVSDAFRRADGGRPVALNLAGSQTLAAQILAGAPADAFASANAAQMARVRSEGLLADSAVVFARNGLAVATAPGNPLDIGGLRDLARPDLAVVMAAPEVPAGRYARQALDEAGVRLRPVSLETDVKQVLAKVALGEADAGIVYRTDVLAAGDAVTGVSLRAEHDQRALYRIGVLEGATSAAGARRFVEFLRSPPGREVLRAHGFGLPGTEVAPRAGDPETE